MSKYTKTIDKAPETLVIGKTTKLITKSGEMLFLEEGDRIQLISIKEQTAETQKMVNDIVDAINAELKDEVIKMKVVNDNSSDMNGVKTTDVTFEFYVPEEDAGTLTSQNVDGIDFTPEFDIMLNDILVAKFGLKSEDLSSNKDMNTISIFKVESEAMPEVEVVEPTVELMSGDDVVIEDEFIDIPVEAYDDEVMEDMMYESAKNSKYVKLLSKVKEADEKKDDKKDEEEDKPAKKDDKSEEDMTDEEKKAKEDEKSKKEESANKKESEDEESEDEEKMEEVEADKEDDEEEKMEESITFNPIKKNKYKL